MFKILVYNLIIILSLSGIQTLNAQCSNGCTFTFNGSGGSYNLNGNQTLCIQSGTFTGTVNFNGSGNVVCINSGAVFNPSNLNNANGITINNNGTFTVGNAHSFGTGTVINNFNQINQNSNFNFNGATQLINHANARWTINANFILQNNSSFTNHGVIQANDEFTSNTGTTIINNNSIRITKNFNPSGVFTNFGFLVANGFININSNSTVRNYCSLFSAEGFNNNSGNTQNFGLVWVTKNNALVQNNSPYFQGPGALTRGERYINNSSVTGSGSYYFTKNTRNQGPFGNDGGGINFYDASGSSNKTFDVVNTVPHSSVTRNPFTPADSSFVWAGCSNAFVAPIARDSSITAVKNNKIKIPLNKIAKDTVSGLDIPRTVINPEHPSQTQFIDTGRGTFTFLPSGEIEFAPDSGFVGTAAMRFVVFNNMGFRSSTGVLSVLVEDPSILPVTLIYFKAIPDVGSVRLEWATAAEINNDYFEIQRSHDGIQFDEIDRISGAGNSSSRINYATSDNFPLEGTNYYRLKQVDFDGTTEYFNIVAVDMSSATSKLTMMVYPNPASDVANLSTNMPVKQVIVSDMTGKVVLSFSGMGERISIPVRSLNAGQYIVQVIFEKGTTATSRLLVE